MSNSLAKYGITPEQEREMWRKQNVDDLLYWADLPFTKKIQVIEDLEEVVRSMHGGKLPTSSGEHEQRTAS